MPLQLSNSSLNAMRKELNIKWPDFINAAVNAGFSESLIHKIISGERNITSDNARIIYSVIESLRPELFEDDKYIYLNCALGIHAYKHEDESAKLDFEEEGATDEFYLSKYDPFQFYKFYANLDTYFLVSFPALCLLDSSYWDSEKLGFDVEKTNRLLKELLDYISQFEIKVQAVRDVSDSVAKFIRLRDGNKERDEKLYKLACAKSSAEQVKAKRWVSIKNYLERKHLPLVYFDYYLFLLTVDELDWNILIAYTLATYENNERAEAIKQKQKNLWDDANR